MVIPLTPCYTSVTTCYTPVTPCYTPVTPYYTPITCLVHPLTSCTIHLHSMLYPVNPCYTSAWVPHPYICFPVPLSSSPPQKNGLNSSQIRSSTSKFQHCCICFQMLLYLEWLYLYITVFMVLMTCRDVAGIRGNDKRQNCKLSSPQWQHSEGPQSIWLFIDNKINSERDSRRNGRF